MPMEIAVAEMSFFGKLRVVLDFATDGTNGLN